MLKCEVCSDEVFSDRVPTFFGDDAGLKTECICSTCFKWSLLHWGKRVGEANILAEIYKRTVRRMRMQRRIDKYA